MEATEKKPRAKKVNARWAAVEAAGLRFRHEWPWTGGANPMLVLCPCCNHPYDSERDFLDNIFMGLGFDDPVCEINPCPFFGCVRSGKSDGGRDVIELWKHARKGSQRDSLMGRIIERCPRLQAAIEAAAQAAILAASTPAAKPAETRSSGRL